MELFFFHAVLQPRCNELQHLYRFLRNNDVRNPEYFRDNRAITLTGTLSYSAENPTRAKHLYNLKSMAGSPLVILMNKHDFLP